MKTKALRLWIVIAFWLVSGCVMPDGTVFRLEPAQGGAPVPEVEADQPEFPKLHPGWTSYTNAHDVRDLVAQGDYVWAATGGGAVRWDIRTGDHVKLTVEHGLVNNYVTSIVAASDGSLWFGTGGGASRLALDGTWTSYTQEDGLAGTDVDSMVEATAAYGSPEVAAVRAA